MSSRVYQYALEVAYKVGPLDLTIATSDSVGVSESVSAEREGVMSDLGLLMSDSLGVSEILSVYYTGDLPPISVSDTVGVSDVLTFIETSGSPQPPRISGTINGNEIEGYARSLRRVAHLCNPGQHATLVMSPDWPHGSNPGKMVFLYENGFQVMKGFTIRSVKSRPSYEWVIEVDDVYTLLTSTFFDTQEVTTAGHDTKYWASLVLERCGCDFNVYGKTPASVPPGVQIGLRPASEALKDILAYASWYAWPDKTGLIQVGEINRSISGRTVTEFTAFEYDVSDDMTRNVVKCYGVGKIFAKSKVAVAGIVPDRIAVVGSPLIQSTAEAQRVADYMTGEIGGLTKIVRGTIPGNPQIKIGNVVTLTHEIDGKRYSVTDAVSSLESNYDTESGYTMEITVGERCPRIAGYSLKPPYLYAGTNGDSVHYSRDKGVSWTKMLSGLPTDNNVARRVAGDSYGKCLSIINNQLWYWTADKWGQVTESMYGTVKAIGSLGGIDQFAVLTGGLVYFSIPSSGSTLPDDSTVSSGSIAGWNSTAITATDFTTGGKLYGYGYDMYTKTGTAYVNGIVSSGSSSGSSDFGGSGVVGGSGYITPSLFGYHLTPSKTIDLDMNYTYGTTTAEVSANHYVLHDIGPNPYISGTLYGAALEIAISLDTVNNNSLGDPTYCEVTGTISYVGNTYGTLSLSSPVSTPDYYAPGIPPESVIGGGSGLTVGPDETINFQLFGPSNQHYDNTWWKPGSLGLVVGNATGFDPWEGTVTVTISSIIAHYESGSYTGWASGSSGSSSGSYCLLTVSGASGSSSDSAIIVSEITGGANITDRLYVSDEGTYALYGPAGRLLISSGSDSTWRDAFPTGNITKVVGITRAQPAPTETITSGSYITVIAGLDSDNLITIMTQGAPETSGGWTVQTKNDSLLFTPSDAIWSSVSTGTVLFGGACTSTKLLRYDPPAPPFVGGDWPVPVGNLAGSGQDVLDLEFGE